MRIFTIGSGNIGGGLGARWERAGHEVVRTGRGGGDASGADAVLVAVPGGAVADALASVTGLGSAPVIDATNDVDGSATPEGFESLAAYVKSVTGAPVAKSFNLNFARIFDQLDDQRVRPSNLYCADEEAREVTEQLIRDAGYEPVNAGDLSAAPLLEAHLKLMFAVNRAGLGPFFYRMAPPGEL
jgi:8-hydroxy-5-deazaflavin:NADPH oxidoreductase